MSDKLFKPDFTHSNINISATLAEFLGAPNSNAILPSLKKELDKNYKNVVFICFDGLGMYPLERNLLSNDFLMRNVTDVLTSTFPSTTTNATTSLVTNKLPLEHGWCGWSMNFEGINRNVNIFLDTDSWTNESIDVTGVSPLSKFPYYFDQAQSDYEINTLFPPYVDVAHPERNTCYNFEMQQFFDAIDNVCHKKGKQFMYAYNNEPDHSMHENGVTCNKTKQLIEGISANLQHLSANNRDTLIIVSADHGQIDIDGYIELYKDEKLYSMLTIYPYMEARAVAFKVKPDCREQFADYFTANYGDDFRLFKSESMIADGYFGKSGNKGNLLGDYIAVMTSHKQALLTPANIKFKGHHTSLTEEMFVPLILLRS
ncbi:MAG: alkaline phosphatase family protein [Corallococcus sp.]|nr:alkaline phosphatase family protein [Corallococcus sp.]